MLGFVPHPNLQGLCHPSAEALIEQLTDDELAVWTDAVIFGIAPDVEG
jgi:hypothetical protein